MIPFRVIAIPSEVASAVRTSRKDPRYGYPAHTDTATGHGPCRHCLQTFQVGAEQRILFTYNPFEGLERIPLPGPIFIHAVTCERYEQNNGYPDALLDHAAVFDAYTKGQWLVAQEHVQGGHLATVERLLQRREIDYIEVRDGRAGCYDFRIERAVAA